jgi:alginate O-acetyltransferase complex protein AlgI
VLFNSFSFIFLFLPLTAAIYYFINKYFPAKWGRIFLIISSLLFVSLWNLHSVLFLIFSILMNYLLGTYLSIAGDQGNKKRKKIIFVAAVAFNILLLGFLKYYNFFLTGVDYLFSYEARPLNLIISVGVSFYTFMQIAWLTDIYRSGGQRYPFISYCLYAVFFPYVISGPISYHREIIPQLDSEKKGHLNRLNICRGLFIFAIGLFKKTVFADTLAIIANGGFDSHAALTFTEAWITSLSYTMQLYFDFSGYTDMAIGSALVFNINIPINFNSPYKSLNIQEFWRRWHITLSRFLRDYIYIPLGGNRWGEWRTLANLMLTFLIAGLWHGAAWTFVFWGILHGLALVIHRLWRKTGISLNNVIAWILTFNFVNIAWIFFRATSWEDALKVLKGMAGFNGILVSPNLASNPFWQKLTVIGLRFGEWRANLPNNETIVYFLCILLIPFVLLTKNSNELLEKFSPNRRNAFAVGIMMAVGLILLNESKVFLYFNF